MFKKIKEILEYIGIGTGSLFIVLFVTIIFMLPTALAVLLGIYIAKWLGLL